MSNPSYQADTPLIAPEDRIAEWERVLETQTDPLLDHAPPSPPVEVAAATMALTGVLLAGGKGRRMGGPKAFLTLKGRPVLEWMVERLRSLCDEFLVVASMETITQSWPTLHKNTGIPLKEFDFLTLRNPGVRVLADNLPNCGPMGGILTGLAGASHPWAFVAACDSPLVTARLARVLLRHAEGAQIVVAEYEGRPQPLLALYHRSVGPQILERVKGNRLKMMDLLKDDAIRVHTVSEAEWRRWNVPPHTFINLNTPEDLDQVQGWLNDPAWSEEREN